MLDLVGNAEYRFSRKSARILTYKFHSIIIGERTGLVVRASDSGSGDPGSILGGSVCCFLEQETFTPQKYWQYPGIGGSVST